MRFTVLVGLLALLTASYSFAQESVCLKTGFCMEADCHMISEDMLIVQSGTGTLQFPVDQVAAITALPARPKIPVVQRPIMATDKQSSIDILIGAALKEGLEPEFVRSVAIVESGLHQNVVSPKGAVGIMQLMPKTAGQLGVDPSRIEQNALGGAAFLRQLLIKYNGNSALALAAYNAGPGAVDKYQGIPPYPETRRYVVKVLAEYAHQQRLQAPATMQAERAKSAPNASALAAEELEAKAAKVAVDSSSRPF